MLHGTGTGSVEPSPLSMITLSKEGFRISAVLQTDRETDSICAKEVEIHLKNMQAMLLGKAVPEGCTGRRKLYRQREGSKEWGEDAAKERGESVIPKQS